jgi:excisionase family DNA binding protein
VAVDGDELTVGQAAEQLSVSDTSVRAWLADHLLRAARWTPGGHARIESTSVEELVPLLRIPPGPERETAFDELRQRNRDWLRRRSPNG